MFLFRKAILIIHGFAGGTYDQEFLANYLELDRSFDVFTFTLPGHDSNNRQKVTKEDWINSAESHLQTLIDNNYHTIYVIGHSMGGVIATHLAAKHKEVKKLVLAAPAFKYLALKNGNFDILEAIKQTPELIKTYNSNEVVSRALKLPLKTLNEFTSLIQEHYFDPKDITIPTLIVQGLNDLVVPKSSSEYVFKTIKSKNKKILFFENTTHDIFRGETKQEISEIVKQFLKY